MPIFERYLSDKDLKQLANYKYKAGEYTYLDEFLSEHFWGPLVYLCPIWLAPNLLTLVGFICSGLGALLTLIYSPTLDSVIPSHICYIIAFCIFLYQTLDALDGKQARRTATFSSLGTLFDHGCDVVTTTFIVIMNIGSFRAGLTSLSIAVMTVTHLCQFICIWYEYYFNYFMAANNKFVGVTELQLAAMSAMIFAGASNGQWSRHQMMGYDIGVIMQAMMFVYQTFQCIYYIVFGIHTLWKQQRSDERDPNIKLRRAITQVCNFVPFIVLEWLFLRESIILGNMYIPIALLIVMFANSTICIRFILASCSNRTFHTIQWPILPFITVTAVMKFGNSFGMEYYQSYSREHLNTVGCCLLVWEFFYFHDFVIDSILGMANTLEINVFRIPYKKKTA